MLHLENGHHTGVSACKCDCTIVSQPHSTVYYYYIIILAAQRLKCSHFSTKFIYFYLIKFKQKGPKATYIAVQIQQYTVTDISYPTIE